MKTGLVSIAACFALAGATMAQSTAFTYQGRLADGGNPANGLHDVRFSLYNVASGGSPIGSAQCVDNVAVVDGFFTTVIDFGQRFATTADRYLEIEVRTDMGLSCANATGFTKLSPRQLMTAAPMASHARSAFSLDAADGSPLAAVDVDANGNVGIGTAAPTGKLDVVGGPIVVVNAGDQADLFWFGSERSWVFRQEGTGAGTALKLESVGGGGNKGLIFDTDGFVSIRAGTTDHYVPGGAEVLRIIRGNIRGDGVELTGSGFACTRMGVGQYKLNFDAAFANVPSVTASAYFTGGEHRFAEICRECAQGLSDRVYVHIFSHNGVLTDSDFSFIAVGPR